MLKNVVVSVVHVGRNAGERVAVEDGDFLAVACCDAGAGKVVSSLRTDLVALSLPEFDGELFVGGRDLPKCVSKG